MDGQRLRARRRILAAARKCFAEVGYEKATLRMIAAEANSDKSSVIKYFGSKEQLFRECVYWTIPIDELTADAPDQSAENYLRSMLSAWARDPHSPMAVLLRVSMTNKEAADLLRSHITTHSVERVMKHMKGPDPELRAGLFAAMMMGIASGRYLLRIPGLAEAELDDVLRVAAPAIRASSPSRRHRQHRRKAGQNLTCSDAHPARCPADASAASADSHVATVSPRSEGAWRRPGCSPPAR